MVKANLKLPLIVFLSVVALFVAPDIALSRTKHRSASHAHKVVLRKKHQHRKKSKHTARKNYARKEQALSVLREYLPQYADILETKEDVSPLSLTSLPQNYDRRSPFSSPKVRYDLLTNIDSWLGTRYRFGGASRRGIDCSGFTSTIMSRTLNEMFAGSSRVQAHRFDAIFSPDSLQFGDMLFFTGRRVRSGKIGHVGIYLGNGVFAHSSTHKGVTFSHITEGYYDQRFRWGGRFVTGIDMTCMPARLPLGM
jgi:cell wall-associated NlpC family hydrolase